MAITVSNLLQNGNTADQNSYTTASVSLSANKLDLLSVVSAYTSGTVNIPTVSGASRTWTQVVTKVDSANNRRITVFRSLSSSANSGALTIDFAGQTQLSCSWIVDEFNNIDLSGTNGANAVVQSASAAVDGTNSGITVTLAAFSGTSNATYGSLRAGAGVGLTSGNGFTQIATYNDGGCNLQSQFKDSNDTSVDWTWPSGTSLVPAIAIEIKHSIPVSGNFFLFF